MSASLQRKLALAQERLRAGDAAGAQAACKDVLARAPRNPEALYLTGVSCILAGNPAVAVRALHEALAIRPSHGPTLENLGLANLMLGAFGEAERVLATASKSPHAPASVFMRLGAAILNQGRYAEAIDVLNHALKLDPRDADIHLNLGQALARMGNPVAARHEFESVLKTAPDHTDAIYNLGVIALECDALDEARGWFERALAVDGRHVDSLVNLGVVLQKQLYPVRAFACLQQALAIQPTMTGARFALASAYLAFGRYDDGIQELHRILGAEANHIGSLAALGDALFKTGQADAARVAAQRASELDPTAVEPYAVLSEFHASRNEVDEAIHILEMGYERTNDNNLLGALTFNYRRVCDWDRWHAVWQQITPVLDHSIDLIGPFSLLCEPTTAEQQLACTRTWCARRFGTATKPATPDIGANPTRDRWRIGYLSSDLREHAIADLVAEVFELHDRKRFEIFAYSHGPDDHSAMRNRLSNACEHFVDIANYSDDRAAARIRRDELDILVDLNGHTRGARTPILALRPCARQASWLGYAATTGASFIDFLIADEFVVPAEHGSAYSEHILRLPHCYIPHDHTRAIDPPLTRAAYGLPEDGFVFCCFAQAYKISPDIFEVWMDVLEQTPGSVLWLAQDSLRARQNLEAAAHAHGMDSGRLHFAPRLPLVSQHLARYAVADLALDTFPYTSHTTGTDALWAGCLMVALCGDTFAARVSGSLVSACGLNDLITYSTDQYRDVALRLANDQPFRREMRERLRSAHTAAPLFDSLTFTRDLENLYCGVLSRPLQRH